MAFTTHMLLKREAQNDLLVRYLVVSLDFNPKDEWKPIGRLTIRKREGRFDFEALNEWAEAGITISQQDNRFLRELADAGEHWMRWRYRIRAWAMHLIQQEHFPEVYPS